jgi:glycerol kinase
MARYILALDQGTTSSRAIIFDESGALLTSAQQEFEQHYPRPGWVEHNPLDIWHTQRDMAQEAVRKAGISASDIAALSITNQRETTVIWDRNTGEPVYNAIVWQCRRTAAMCDELKAAGFDSAIREKTGLVTDAYFSGTKVAWILENVPGVRARAERGELAFGTVDSWLIWKLSGGRLHITDVTNASRTMLFNIHTLEWDSEILARLNIPHSLLPEVKPSSMVYGETDAALFGAPLPIAGIAGDQQAATFGQTCYAPGQSKNTYGTGCFMLMNTGEQAINSKGGLLTTIAWQVDGSRPVYALEGSVFIAGAAVQWLRDGLGLIAHASETAELASSVSDSGGVYLVPAFVGLGAPYWDPYARGTIVGLTRGTTRAHIVRATLEAICFQSRDLVQNMIEDAGLQLAGLRVDGGAVVNDVLMQMQADILGVPVQRPAVIETTALGSALLAGLATGVWSSQAEVARQWRVDREFAPQMSDDQRESLYAGWLRAVERSRGWIEN